MGKGSTDPRFIFPYMLITLENVLVKSWNITASGDDRPSESISLWYDKAAMRYYRTKDGKVWIGGQVSGWNQKENKEWIEVEISNKYFSEPRKG
jgi:type VI protein secretion system component Hcp